MTKPKEGKILKEKIIKIFEGHKVEGIADYHDYLADLIVKLFKQKLKEKEKEIIEDLKIKVAEAIMWNDKHPTVKELEALYNYLDSLNSDT